MKSLNSLPDLCLVTIFSRIPLCDLIRNRRVCSKWKWLQSIVTAQIRSLTILVGKDAFQLIECSAFKSPSGESEHILNDDGTPMYSQQKLSPFSSLAFQTELETDTVFFLASMFTNVRSLKIALNKTDSTQSMMVGAFLFRLMSPSVVTLEMFCDFNSKNHGIPQFVSRQLFNSINSMSSLKILTLDFQNRFTSAFLFPGDDPSEQTTSIDLTIIFQLDELNFYSSDYDRTDMMFETLKRYAQPGLRPLRIQYGCELHKEFSNLDEFEPQFCRRFTRFVANICYVPSVQLNNFCNRFTSITYVCLDVMNITIRHLFDNLAKLTQLIQLELDIDFPTMEPDEQVHQLLAQSPSVKSLCLGISVSNHDNLSLLNLPWTCPNVQVINVQICDYEKVCDICNEHEEEIVPETNCYKRALLPLQHCPRLHTVTNFYSGSFEATKIPLTKADLMQPIELSI